MARVPVRNITASTDRNPSVVRRLADAFASQLAALWEQLQAIYENGFVETETGGALDELAVGVRKTDEINERPRRWLGPVSAAVVVIAASWIACRRCRRC
jgi:hypothetical protein